VFVPDYIPHPPPADSLDSAIEWYPGEKKEQGWLASLWGKVSLLKLLPYARGILDGQALPMVDKVTAGREYCTSGSWMVNAQLTPGHG
jgi:hypothetical protein